MKTNPWAVLFFGIAVVACGGCDALQHREAAAPTPTPGPAPHALRETGRFQLLYAPEKSGPLVLRMDTTTGETWWLEERKHFAFDELVKGEPARFRWASVMNDKKYPWEGAEGDHVWTPEEVKKLREPQSSGDPLGLFTPEENAKRKANQK